jgi:hypothetical protein
MSKVGLPGERVGQDGDNDGEEQGVAEEGKRDNKGGAQDQVEVGSALNSYAVEAEPDPVRRSVNRCTSEVKWEIHTITTTW